MFYDNYLYRGHINLGSTVAHDSDPYTIERRCKGIDSRYRVARTKHFLGWTHILNPKPLNPKRQPPARSSFVSPVCAAPVLAQLLGQTAAERQSTASMLIPGSCEIARQGAE